MLEELTETPTDAVVVHPPHGFVKLESYHASDLDVVNAARVSFRKRSDWNYEDDTGRALTGSDEGVLRFLLKAKHGTPFEQNYFQFHIRAPIFVFREWHRHRVGISINEESARYVPLKPHFYLPDDDHVRVQEGKPGHYTYVSKGHEMIPPEVDAKWGATYGRVTRDTLECSYQDAYKRYEYLMAIGVAKELARACLPVGIYSQMLWACNARSLMNFLALRNAPKALREIRDYAEVMEGMFAEVMPVTAAAFIENGRIAP